MLSYTIVNCAIVATFRYNVTTIQTVQYNGRINPRHAAAHSVVLINSLQRRQLKIINWTSRDEESFTCGVRAPTQAASRRRSGDADRRRGQCTFISNAERIVCSLLVPSLPSATDSGDPVVRTMSCVRRTWREDALSRFDFYYASRHSWSRRKVSVSTERSNLSVSSMPAIFVRFPFLWHRSNNFTPTRHHLPSEIFRLFILSWSTREYFCGNIYRTQARVATGSICWL